MPVIIIVQGKSNSGKTRSIRQFLANYGVPFPPTPPDIQYNGIFVKGPNTYKLGVCSAGDTPTYVDEAWRYFDAHNCDLLVCATKSYGQTVDKMFDHLKNRIYARNDYSVHWLHTNKVAGLAAQAAATAQTAQDIYNRIP